MSTYEQDEQFDLSLFMEENRITDEMAERDVYAHGRIFKVAEAIVECPPFAQQIRSTVEALQESVPDEALREVIISNVLTKTIDSMAAQSETVEVAEDFLGQETQITQPRS